MTQKLIESLEFSKGAGGRWCIYQIVKLLLVVIILVIIYKMWLLLSICAILRDMNAFWRRWRQDNWDVPIDIVYVGCPPSSPTWEWDTSGYKTIPKEILCMTICKMTGTLHIYGNSLNVHWKLFVQTFLLWSKSWLWCVTSATFWTQWPEYPLHQTRADYE